MKRGPYRAATKEYQDTEDSWTPESERSVRPRRSINYREAKDESSDSDSSSESEQESIRAGEPPRRHSALFKMVLAMMHGDLVLPPEQPALSDLAAVCAEVFEMELKNQALLELTSITSFEQDRTENNRTPAPQFIRRDVPSPPSTPASLKPYQPNILHPNNLYSNQVALMSLQRSHYDHYRSF